MVYIPIEQLRMVQCFVNGEYTNKRISAIEAGEEPKIVQAVEDPSYGIYYVLDGTHETFVAMHAGKTVLQAWLGYEKNHKKASLCEIIIDTYLSGNPHNWKPEDFTRKPEDLLVY